MHVSVSIYRTLCVSVVTAELTVVVLGVRQVEAKRNEDKTARDAASEKYVQLVDKQRQYFKAVLEFQEVRVGGPMLPVGTRTLILCAAAGVPQGRAAAGQAGRGQAARGPGGRRGGRRVMSFFGNGCGRCAGPVYVKRGMKRERGGQGRSNVGKEYM